MFVEQETYGGLFKVLTSPCRCMRLGTLRFDRGTVCYEALFHTFSVLPSLHVGIRPRTQFLDGFRYDMNTKELPGLPVELKGRCGGDKMYVNFLEGSTAKGCMFWLQCSTFYPLQTTNPRH